MSADNYAICPRCLAEARGYRAAALQQIDESSRAGVSEGILKAARAGVKEVNPENYRTFREEYEFYGITSGFVKVDFYGECQECGLSASVREEYPIPGLEGLDIEAVDGE